ncbi:hypothetical protein AVEN_88406-1 [Araneus ventricosus]|uniref:Uncharacterized protein n=1 Tax=Araneus ventricosus TaxID=182803 RepID=A0A4Y2PMA8_ARAVE|nr:hypothetical protein AVEN_88406-1 [Araneus ventricosus]
MLGGKSTKYHTFLSCMTFNSSFIASNHNSLWGDFNTWYIIGFFMSSHELHKLGLGKRIGFGRLNNTFISVASSKIKKLKEYILYFYPHNTSWYHRPYPIITALFVIINVCPTTIFPQDTFRIHSTHFTLGDPPSCSS